MTTADYGSWGSQVTERLSKSPKVTELLRWQSGICTPTVWLSFLLLATVKAAAVDGRSLCPATHEAGVPPAQVARHTGRSHCSGSQL